MIRAIRVVKVGQGGYLVIGKGTFSIGDEIDISHPSLNPEELRDLVKNDYVVFC